ncbi:hypothetical protein CARUB_v10007290mg [Capsella rubella]|uniref:Uncharacterized protein n=1 Tax=Capsella rubella TaxID=81985 RepID=R0F9Q0_9BRAS|nr:hypothetical protein CARUB_v10007290mg [Capsella rubella]
MVKGLLLAFSFVELQGCSHVPARFEGINLGMEGGVLEKRMIRFPHLVFSQFFFQEILSYKFFITVDTCITHLHHYLSLNQNTKYANVSSVSMLM